MRKKKQGQNKGEKDGGKQMAIKNQIEKGEKIKKGESATSIVIQKKHKSHLSRKRLLRFSLFVKTRNKIPAACEQFNHKRPNLLRFLPPFS
jgi:hypothetical protein